MDTTERVRGEIMNSIYAEILAWVVDAAAEATYLTSKETGVRVNAGEVVADTTIHCLSELADIFEDLFPDILKAVDEKVNRWLENDEKNKE